MSLLNDRVNGDLFQQRILSSTDTENRRVDLRRVRAISCKTHNSMHKLCTTWKQTIIKLESGAIYNTTAEYLVPADSALRWQRKGRHSFSDLIIAGV